jgi:S-adenosylmethionine hydrolase
MKGPAANYAVVPKGRAMPLLGSLGYLEIAAHAVSAQKLLKAGIGTKMELTLL